MAGGEVEMCLHASFWVQHAGARLPDGGVVRGQAKRGRRVVDSRGVEQFVRQVVLPGASERALHNEAVGFTDHQAAGFGCRAVSRTRASNSAQRS